MNERFNMAVFRDVMPRSVVDAGHGFGEIRRLISVYKRYLFTGTARSSVTPVPRYYFFNKVLYPKKSQH